jgi:hypothetical protein
MHKCVGMYLAKDDEAEEAIDDALGYEVEC